MHLVFANWIVWLLTPANWWIVFQVAAGLGFVIFVHELGHFLVAKACGVKCEKFYLGFDIAGLKLLKFKAGETEYGIGILPLGGYVKMLGQDDNPARMAEENRRARAAADMTNEHGSPEDTEHAPPLTHGDLPPEPVSDPHAPYDPRSYMAQSVPKRMAIISAGVIMNVIFAFIMAAVAYSIGVMETPCIVQSVIPGGAAWKADLEPGDIVRRIGDIENPWFRDLRAGVTLGDIEEGIPFEIERPSRNETFTVTLRPDSKLGVPMIGIIGPHTLKLFDPPVAPYSPASRAEPKFEAGDVIAQLDGTSVETAVELTRLLANKVDQAVEVLAKRMPEGAKNAAEGVPAPEPEHIRTRVEPTVVMDLGLVMKMGPIVAVQDDSPAAKAGIQAGDRLVLINGQPTGNPLTLPQRMRTAAAAGEAIRLVVEREADGQPAQRISVEATPRMEDSSGEQLVPVGPMSVPQLGIAYEVLATVESVVPGTPAAKEGVRPGDVVTSARIVPPEEEAGEKSDKRMREPVTIRFGEKDPAWPYLVFEILPFVDPQSTVKLELESSQEPREASLRPIPLKDEAGNSIYTSDRGFNLTPLEVPRVVDSLGETLRLGAQETLDNLLMVYRFLQKIGQQQISVKLLGGPVEIFRQAGYSAKAGLSKFLLFLTMLSANLAVINFLPIPVLDGGHMVFLLYELIRGKPASERVIIAFTYAGMLFLLTLMVFVLALDVGIISRR